MPALSPNDWSGDLTECPLSRYHTIYKTTVDVESPELSASPSSGITSPGTPVDATLHLRDDGTLAGVTDAVRDFSRQIGL